MARENHSTTKQILGQFISWTMLTSKKKLADSHSNENFQTVAKKKLVDSPNNKNTWAMQKKKRQKTKQGQL